MGLSPRIRKAGLTLHVLSSVGWVGAVLVYLALGLTAVTSDDVSLISAVYLAMDAAAWTVLVPLALTSLVTGISQSLISSWGLWRHYWVIVKLALTGIATAVLLLYTQTLAVFADVAGRDALRAADLSLLRGSSVVLHSAGALVLLVMATGLAIYKPAGLTRRGQRHRHQVGLARVAQRAGTTT